MPIVALAQAAITRSRPDIARDVFAAADQPGLQRVDELAALEDAEELCRRLLAAPFGWGSSTSHMEAVELLAKAHGTSELPMSVRGVDCVHLP